MVVQTKAMRFNVEHDEASSGWSDVDVTIDHVEMEDNAAGASRNEFQNFQVIRCIRSLAVLHASSLARL